MKKKSKWFHVNRHLALVLMALFLPLCYAFAAEIKGKVTDSSNAALSGVTVVVKGKNVSTITDGNGTFTISAEPSNVLVFSYVGFDDQEVAVGTETFLNISLLEKKEVLGEVVVVGYGRASRKSLSSAITSIKPEEMNRGTITDVGRLLQGKVAGLNITSGGDPNRRAAVVLRGASTINSPGGPFYVIDGVPGADISLVAPDDIATIDVLKDAAATAIYGNRASAGVIMITTKKGAKGKAQVSYNGFAGGEWVSSRLSMMDESQHRAYLTTQGLSYNPNDDKGANTNWQDAVMRDYAFSHNHNLSIGGGGENGNYNASINYVDKEGIMKGSSMERFIARLNIEQRALNDKLKFNLNVTNSNTRGYLVPILNTVLEQVTNHLPVSPVFNPDGTWFENFNTTGYYNPVGMMENAKDDYESNTLVASLSTEVKLPAGFTYTLFLSHQKLSSLNQQFYSSYYNQYGSSNFYTNPDPGYGVGTSLVGTLFGQSGAAYRNYYQTKQNNLETFLTWSKKFDDHSFNAVLGFNWLNTIAGDGIQSSSTNFPSDFISYNNLSLGNPYAVPSYRIAVAGGASEKRLISDFARLNYSYKEKYLLQGSIRRDGSSVFGENYQWGYFPSVGAAWRISNESFMENSNVFDDLKFRASYGVTGNSEGIGPFNSKLVYGVTGTYYNNGTQDNSFGPLQGANPDLRWERTSTLNFGLDFTLLKGVLTGAIDVYDKNTEDMLFQYRVSPALVPGGSIWANGGSVNNKGIEFMLTAKIINKSNFTWNSTINFAHNKNKITSLTNPYSTGDSILYTTPRGAGQTGASIQILKVGRPIGQYFSFIYEGKDKDGLSQFRKKDGTLTTQPLAGTDYYYVGDAQPSLMTGWSNSFTYKNWDLNVFFRGVFGTKVFNVTRANLSYTPNATTNNLSSLVTAEDKAGDARNGYYSTRYIESGDYVRLDNATLGYNFNLKSSNFSRIRAYITGENLFTITNYSGIDPEINQGGTAPGVDNNNFYPKTTVMMVGLNIVFR
ncbi:MAG: SusC/RagA family TonB-linked outer membrane protein [Bacteroidota bacterium]